MVRGITIALVSVGLLAFGAGASAQSRQPMPKIVEEAPPLATAGPAISVVRFDPDKLEWSRKPGKNVVTGDAILRTRGGGIRTCAATDAQLWPLSDYTLSYLGEVFLGNGYSDPERTQRLLKSMEPGVYRYVRAAVCNGQGVFTFRDVPDGRYFLTASVTWEVPLLRSSGEGMQGGDLGQLISVQGGQTLEVTLTK